jgi:hypothetical protein
MVHAVTSTIIAAPARVSSARICRIEQSSSESDTVIESSGDNGQNDSNESSTNDEIEYGSNNGKDNDVVVVSLAHSSGVRGPSEGSGVSFGLV